MNEFELTINVSVRQVNNYNGSLQVNETVVVPAAGFLALCQVLGQFHELAESLKGKTLTSAQ